MFIAKLLYNRTRERLSRDANIHKSSFRNITRGPQNDPNYIITRITWQKLMWKYHYEFCLHGYRTLCAVTSGELFIRRSFEIWTRFVPQSYLN